MKKTVYLDDFRNAFVAYDRANNFTYKGLSALYDYFMDYENDCGIEIELDVIAICCEYTEYKDLEEVQGDYNNIENIEDLRNNTQVIEMANGGIIIQAY